MKLKTLPGIFLIIAFSVTALLVVRGSVLLMVVLSGSMEPIMMPGDVVIVVPHSPDQMEVGDLMSFYAKSENGQIVVTHRVVAVDWERGFFSTKGDNNKVMDQNPVKFSDLIGKTITLIPYLGYLVLMGRQLMVYLVFIPSAIVILSEVRAMMTNPVLLLKRERQQRKLERLPVSVNYRRLLTIFILTSLPFWILGLPSLALTNIGGEGAKYGQGNTITIQGAGLMDQIYVIRDNDKPILPGYGVISPEKSVEVQVQDPGAVTVSMTPAVIPIFWAVNLASVHPAFPALVTSLIPGLLILLVLYPLWIGRRRSRSKRRMRRLPFGSSIV